MRRRSPVARAAALVLPMLAASPLAAETQAPSAKAPRDAEAAPAQARVVPTPGDVAPADPVGAAFELFPGPPAPPAEAAATAEPAPAEAVAPGFRPRRVKVPLPRRRPAEPVATEPEMRVAALPPATVEPPPAIAVGEGPAFGEPKKIPSAAEPYMALLRREAAANEVPLWLAVGVGWVESKYQPKLRGRHGVVGLMQVMPSTARHQGYKGPTEKLIEPETNIIWGMKELGWDWAKSGGNPCLAIAKYKGGIATKRISPAAADYCRKAKAVTGMG